MRRFLYVSSTSFLVIFFLLISKPAFSQTLDDSFMPFFGGVSWVTEMRKQPDDKLIIVGSFAGIAGQSLTATLARLNADGSVDETFQTHTISEIEDVAIQPDGKILVGGTFRSVNGTPHFNLVRLNTDGTIDEDFHSAITSTLNFSRVSGILVLPNNKILCVGSFGYPMSKQNIIRLNSDGSKDESFLGDIDFGADDICITPLSNGRTLLAGQFTLYNDTTVSNLVVIDSDGFIDTDFLDNLGTATTETIYDVGVQSTGKIIIAGSFSSFNGVSAQKIVRLNADGTVDNTFTANAGYNSGNSIQAIKILDDDRIVTGGTFQTPKKRIAVLTADGALDNTFNPGTGLETTVFNPEVYDIDVNDSNQIIFSGSFATYNGYNIISMARVAMNGTLDETFAPNPCSRGLVKTLAKLADGKIIAGGNFVMVNEAHRKGLVRLNKDGSIDETFDIGSGFSSPVEKVAVQSDNEILVGGTFNTYKGVNVDGLVRLNNTGAIDGSFTTAIGRTYSTQGIYCMHIQDDGKIILGGDFNSVNGTSIHNLARINADGSFDSNFHLARTSFSETITTIREREADGKFIVTEAQFDEPYVKLLNADGSIDTNFDAGSRIDKRIRDADFLPDGNIVLGGSFTTYDSNPVESIIVVDDLANIVTGFKLTPGFGTLIPNTFLKFNNRLTTGGIYESYNLTEPTHYLKIVDFAGANYNDLPILGAIYSLLEGGPDTLYAGGSVRKAGDATVGGLVRLIAAEAPLNAPLALEASAPIARTIDLNWTANKTTESSFEIQRSKNDNTHFATVGFASPDSSHFIDVNSLEEETLYYYRLRGTSLGGNSGFSNEVSITTQPDPPTAPSHVTLIEKTHNSITISWNDNADDELGFIISADENAADTVAANDTTFTVTGLSASTWYIFYVRAYNSGGASNAAILMELTMPTPPDAPDSLTIVSYDGAVVELAWRDNSNTPGIQESNFKVYRSVNDSEHFQHLGYSSQNNPTFTDYNIEPTLDYYYKVVALNYTSESVSSNYVHIIAPIPAPHGFLARSVGMSAIELTWQDTLAHETGFRIYQQAGSEIVPIASLAPNTTSFVVDSLLHATYYYFYITATDVQTESFRTTGTGTTTLAIEAGDWFVQPVTNIPPRSHAVGFSIGEMGYVGLGENASGKLADMWRYNPGDNSWTEVASFPGTARSSAVAFAIGDTAYVGTGIDATGRPLDFYAYIPATDSWTQVTDYPANINSGGGTSGAVAFVIDGYGYVGLGNTGVNNPKNIYRYDPVSNVWEERAEFEGAGRFGAGAATISGDGIVAMGSTGLSKSLETWTYDPAQNVWSQHPDYSGPARSGGTGFAINNEAFICGGLEGDFFTDAPTKKVSRFSFNGSWYEVSELPGEARSYATSFVIGELGYVFGGLSGSNDYINDLLVYQPGTALRPTRPENHTVKVLSSTSALMTWDDALREDGYKILVAKGSQPYELIATLPADATAFTVENLESGFMYHFLVQAFNNYGFNNGVGIGFDLYVPETPGNFQGTATGPGSIDLSWNDLSSQETGFELYRSEGDGALTLHETIDANTTAFTDMQNISPGGTYRYALRALNSSTSASAFTDTITIVTPILIPGNFAGQLLNENTVQLTWLYDDNTAEFDIYRSENTGTFTLLTTVQNATAYNDSQLNPETTYSYKLQARFGTNLSAFTDALTFEIPDAKPYAPSQLSMDATVTEQIRITWQDNSINEDGFLIYRKLSGGMYQKLDSLGTDITEYQTVIEVETEYVFGVSAINSLGESGLTELVVFVQPDIPEAPSNLAASFENGKIVLTWTDNSLYENGFEIFRADKGESPITIVDKNVTSYGDDNLIEGTFTYVYKVRSKNGKGASGFSDEVSVDVTITGIEKGRSTAVVVYPTPATKSFTLKNNASTNKKFIINSPLGSEIARDAIPGGEEKLFEIAEWPSGIYLIQIEGERTIKLLKM